MMQREAIAGLRRSRDACLGGVCAGIAQRYDVDPIIIRILALLVAAVTFGLAAIVYVALWAALPQEPLSSELYDIAPEQAESSAYGCVDCSKSAHLRGDGESLSIIVWLIVAICLMLLFLLVALNVSPMVKCSQWWQFWPLALSIVGVGLIVIPVHGCREAAWHALGVVITAFAISCLPMSLGILSWHTFSYALERLWILLALAAALFVIGLHRSNGALVILGSLLVAVFCLSTIALFAIPGDVANLMILMPDGRSLRIAISVAWLLC